MKILTFKVVSSWPYSNKFSLRAAEKGSNSNPCTNWPLICPSCAYDSKTKHFPAIWKHNFSEHLAKQHDSYALNDSQLPPNFHCTIQVSEEQLGLKFPRTLLFLYRKLMNQLHLVATGMLLPNKSEDTWHSWLRLVTNEVKNNHSNILTI